jgi:hypothetical protein
MKRGRPTESCKIIPDQTLNSKWLVQHSDRLIYYEFERMRITRSTEEIFPDELADRIGRTREYVCGIIKNAISRAKSCHNPSSNKP